jgi:hypothetical protein
LPGVEGGPDARAGLEAGADVARELQPLAELHGPHGRIVDLVGGSPGTVQAGLADFIAATGNELIVRSAIPDHSARVVIRPTRAAWDHARS